MSQNFHLPPIGFGPGSQPGADDGTELEYVPMPSGMRTFDHHTPDLHDPVAMRPALDILAQAGDAAARWAEMGIGETLPLDGLDASNLAFLADALGEGEVLATIEDARAGIRIEAQESVFAGLWRVREVDGEGGTRADRLEVGAAPAAIFGPLGAGESDLRRQDERPVPPKAGPGVVNAPAILTEVWEHADAHVPGLAPHVINLTLLPHTPEDLAHLAEALGRGRATILSRGYGNCRIEQCADPVIWRVRFFNSQDAQILDTIEICDLPEAALAAKEDLEDSAERLREVLEALQ